MAVQDCSCRVARTLVTFQFFFLFSISPCLAAARSVLFCPVGVGGWRGMHA